MGCLRSLPAFGTLIGVAPASYSRAAIQRWLAVSGGPAVDIRRIHAHSSSQENDDEFSGAKVRLNGWQRAAVAFGSAVGAFINPARADLVAALGETTGKLAFERILETMKMNTEGKRILSERPRVLSSTVGHAWDLPANTFGAAYAKFMGSRNFSPDDRPPVRFLDTEELAYVATRAREVHDFWHVLFRLPTNVTGESALKMVEFQQTYLPMCFLSVIGGSVRLKMDGRQLLFKQYLPWAVRAGSSCANLMCIYYEKHFHEDLEDVRQKWRIIPAPPFPRKPVH
eukprot:c21017_g1_i1 orf=287-1138(-)